jgi:protein-disulfide isomerase
MTSKDSRSRKQKDTNKLTVPVNIGSDHIQGSINNTPITLVEYGDYECPYTGMAYPVVKEIMKELGDDKICFVFRNFSLNDIHPLLSMRPKQQKLRLDKFWQMQDYLFEHQKALDDGHLLEYAQKVGLQDVRKFKDDVSRHVYAPLIEESLKGGIDSGVEGTPTFFINGVLYEDSFDLKTFSGTLQKYLYT